MGVAECSRCKSTNFIEKPDEKGVHYAKLCCADCGQYIRWVPKPKNAGKEKVNNGKWREKWREKLGGELVCFWCGIKESATRMGFHIDHVLPRKRGGKDEFENTQPLCAACHWSRHADIYRAESSNLVKLEDLNRQQMYEDYLETFSGEEVPSDDPV